jgi:hypothetical protein
VLDPVLRRAAVARNMINDVDTAVTGSFNFTPPPFDPPRSAADTQRSVRTGMRVLSPSAVGQAVGVPPHAGRDPDEISDELMPMSGDGAEPRHTGRDPREAGTRAAGTRPNCAKVARQRGQQNCKAERTTCNGSR